VSPSVVQIAASVNDSGSIDEETSVQSGTGFVWDVAGHIVTNYHVVQGAKFLAVQFASGDVRKASIVDFTRKIDDRMPVVLEQFDLWLSGTAGTESLKPAREDTLQMWPVSRKMNRVGNDDDPKLIEAIQ
jgi:Trypsin-like peptidase domain